MGERILVYDIRTSTSLAKSPKGSSTPFIEFSRIPHDEGFTYSGLLVPNQDTFVISMHDPLKTKPLQIEYPPVVFINIRTLNDVLKVLEGIKKKEEAENMIRRLEPMCPNSSVPSYNLLLFLWFYFRSDIASERPIEIIRTSFNLFFSDRGYSPTTLTFASAIIEKLNADTHFSQKFKETLLYLIIGVLDPLRFGNEMRQSKIPGKIIATLPGKKWNAEHARDSEFNRSQYKPNETTIEACFLIHAAKSARKFFRVINFQKGKEKLLEVYSGNGKAGTIFNHSFGYFPREYIISTDIVFGSVLYDAASAVKTFADECCVLLLISPQPSCFGDEDWGHDIWAYMLWIMKKKTSYKNAFIIFIGELGRSDGSEGGYNFLMTHPDLRLVHKVVLIRNYSIGGITEKTLYIFMVACSGFCIMD